MKDALNCARHCEPKAKLVGWYYVILSGAKNLLEFLGDPSAKASG